MRTITLKRKNLLSPWITKVLIKSSKRKQKLFLQFLKKKSFKNEQNYKTYKNLFEKIKHTSKKVHFTTLLKKHQSNSKK